MSTKPGTISCPYCGSPMFAGKSEVRGTWLSYMLAGFSIQHLWFRAESRKIRRKIIASSTESPAHMCERCGAIAIVPQKSFSERVDRAFHEISHYIENRPNQRPDGTPAKSPPSNPSQGAAVPHP